MENFQSSSLFDGGNMAYLEELYEIYLQNPEALPKEWGQFFEKNLSLPKGEGVFPEERHSEIRAQFAALAKGPRLTQVAVSALPGVTKEGQVEELINAYRLLGHQIADINPIMPNHKPEIPELMLKTYGLTEADLNQSFSIKPFYDGKRLTLQKIQSILKTAYCGTLSCEFMHIGNLEERQWIANRVESLADRPVSPALKKELLDTLLRADGLEKYLGAKYPGAKRFSLEGNDSYLILLEHMIQQAGINGTKEVVIAMAHRGRLNVLINLLGKHPAQLFDVFEGKEGLADENKSGDVKYHEGFSSDISTSGGTVHLALAFNPSHLEIVCPVVCGSVKARQDRRTPGTGQREVMPILAHGDAAFAGQGVAMETLNMSQTRGFCIGGSIHIIINNQIGFTTSDPRDARSTPYASDLGKMIQSPIFHLNADDPEMAYRLACLAVEYRAHFHKDILIDLIGYRRHGHNEADEPAATQPTLYAKIRQMPTVSKKYGDTLIERGFVTPDNIRTMQEDYRLLLDSRNNIVARQVTVQTENFYYALKWRPFMERRWQDLSQVDTQCQRATLDNLGKLWCRTPDQWQFHPRVEKILYERRQMQAGKIPVDWGYAENMAYATLLHEGYSVRMTGQDCTRGTFFHRHAILHNLKTGEMYIPLQQFAKSPAHFSIYDSLLSEEGVLAFEYGYSCSDPEVMVLWEAQFGDFANGAQVVIDQFISSGEQKWGRLCDITLLLPHGYEGQGPEHSSARLERYLQLSAQHNMWVCVPTTPAQIFHLLRRQMHSPTRMPLIVMSPKTLLRHRLAVSSLDELASGTFQHVIFDAQLNQDQAERVILCSGKIYYEIVEAREKAKLDDKVAIFRVEQLYPFPETLLKQVLSSCDKAKEIVWCQEEPRNQGAWYAIKHHLGICIRPDQMLVYAGRADSASVAVGSHVLHEKQQHELVQTALGLALQTDKIKEK